MARQIVLSDNTLARMYGVATPPQELLHGRCILFSHTVLNSATAVVIPTGILDGPFVVLICMFEVQNRLRRFPALLSGGL